MKDLESNFKTRIIRASRDYFEVSTRRTHDEHVHKHVLNSVEFLSRNAKVVDIALDMYILTTTKSHLLEYIAMQLEAIDDPCMWKKLDIHTKTRQVCN